MFHIVDDEEAIREFLTEVIHELGYESRVFGSPLEYLEYVSSGAYRLPYALLTDIQMPEMNGYDMLDKVREHHPEVCTAVVSGFAKYEGEAIARSCAFVTKPIDLEDFKKLIESFVACQQYRPVIRKNIHANTKPDREFNFSEWICPHSKHCQNC